MAVLGDRYRWGQHRHGEWWQGTDRLKNRKLETLPARPEFQPGTKPVAALARLLESDHLALQLWESL